ncbi:MAG TPA: CehA/McbA family metallohydrolase [Cyclobacteriaceae bacterium]|nr:CehA/McbA family metallohydrolase [Cyclobacteriaceae bacterium]
MGHRNPNEQVTLTGTFIGHRKLLCSALVLFAMGHCFGQKKVLDNGMHHLRNTEPREWSEFSLKAEGPHYTIRFPAKANPTDMSLSLRQYDVKQRWVVTINDNTIGTLEADEKDLINYFRIPSGVLRDGENVLHISTQAATPDDIRIGSIMLYERPKDGVLAESRINVRITDTDTDELLPGRITIVDQQGILQSVATASNGKLAVRPGYVYTGTGHAAITLPAGTYTLYAGRGFEYGIDSIRLELKPGEHLERTFRISREVSTEGWVSCDTHIHTLTHSGHGDASLEDRAITIAGEGIELPILTDHNINADLKPATEALALGRWFTPVTGNEVTTKVGHFNVFPTVAGASAIDHSADDWNGIIENMGDDEKIGVVILNHAQDIHNDFRPFGADHHLSAAGVDTGNWRFPANAMEVINSGSQQTDIMGLYRDWFGMLNRGYFLTPVGSSDSHDVSRYTVGQGRTYIRSNDEDPSNIDVSAAIENFREGRVMVSLGLLTRIVVNDTYGPGETVPAADQYNVTVEVSGPAWAKASRVTLYANGKPIREEAITTPAAAGVKGRFSWAVPIPAHDVFLVAIAEGPGDGMPYWPIAKPYQPASPDWQPKLLGSTGAVWIDADGNGKANAAYDYAKKIVDDSRDDMGRMIEQLVSYDEAVAVQAAAILWSRGVFLTSGDVAGALKEAPSAVKSAFETVIRHVPR